MVAVIDRTIRLVILVIIRIGPVILTMLTIKANTAITERNTYTQ